MLASSGFENADRAELRRCGFPRKGAELAGGGFGGRLGGFAVIADDADEGLGGAGKAAVAAVDEAELAPEVHAFLPRLSHSPWQNSR